MLVNLNQSQVARVRFRQLVPDGISRCVLKSHVKLCTVTKDIVRVWQKQTCYGKIKSGTGSLHFLLTEWKCPFLNTKWKRRRSPERCWKNKHHRQLKGKNHLYWQISMRVDIKSGAVKGYLVMPDSQLSLNKEGEADSSSWSTSCLNRLPGWKLPALSAFVDGGVCRRRRRREKTTSVS